MMDGVPILRPTTLISNSHELEGFAFILNALVDSILLVGYGGEWMMTKTKMLQSQSKSMAIVASCYASTFKIRNVFIMGKVEINN
jgi:hypothetical protein